MILRALALSAAIALSAPATAAAEPYTAQFRGDGSSSFGFAWDYARWDARDKAIADGFTDPPSQCVEIFAFGSYYSAMVIWECTREI